MSKVKVPFRILLIDDDVKMNDLLEMDLETVGKELDVKGFEFDVHVDRLDVKLVSDENRQTFFRFSNETFLALYRLSRSPRYDLIIADWGFADEEAQKVLWGKNNSRQPIREEAEGRLFNIRHLRTQFHDWLTREGRKSGSIFLAARRVLLRSMVSKRYFDWFGGIQERLKDAQAAFKNAEIIPFDPRNEFYGGDEYYQFYDCKQPDHPDGRAFYRQLVKGYIRKVAVVEILIFFQRLSNRLRIRKSVFNIAAFAGAVTIIGSSTQYLGGTGLKLLASGQSVGWWFIGAGLFFLIFGSLTLALTFESFTRYTLRLLGPEDEFTSK
jgi:hypothetical protein